MDSRSRGKDKRVMERNGDNELLRRLVSSLERKTREEDAGGCSNDMIPQVEGDV